MSKEQDKWLKEYQSFLDAEKFDLPKGCSEKVFNKMKNLLQPSFLAVFSKLLLLNAVAGFFSLSVCHQFGMNPFGTSSSLDIWFMQMWGHHTCTIICGSLFIGLPILLSGWFLSIEEVRTLKRYEFGQTFTLGIIALAIFSLMGAEIAFVFASLWLFGALIGGWLATETLWVLKSSVVTFKFN